ncbi:uncharacterized protein LOC110109403 isoform X1 [Dendrobium catenatum]|uniref:uncharacterized protein LOC110109403 isoform X1 n=1 Tax=Dendrobium catenatum TaxID=906689 RepID=UPI0010A00880|nr:uncharacterized protein LOC110109403 isoform X1 [Dendrobium catenatum]XP_020696126.2 uncharacterized protein LOC110109403 isoform X1 [Dendrobium catenatum]
MGAICSKGSAVDFSASHIKINVGCKDDARVSSPSKLKSYGNSKALLVGGVPEKRSLEQSFSFSEGMSPNFGRIRNGTPAPRHHALSRVLSEKSWSTKWKGSYGGKSGTQKVAEVGLLLGRAGSVGFGKAVEVLDTISSSVTSLNTSSGFSSRVTTKGNKISILAFEVANTIVKGANLLHSLSEENTNNLKGVVLPSEAVQNLVSEDMDELLRIAATDKREELKVFCGEVVRFGNRCKDPQWHNLDRYFANNSRLGSELASQQQCKEQAAEVMQQLMILVQYTAELYHELHALDRFSQEYRRKLQEEENSAPIQKVDNLQILRQELKSQEKHVKSLKKKSLWSTNLEEVMEKLVEIVHFLHFEIHEVFVNAAASGSYNGHQRLGPTGLALHYANVINQIDTIVSRSGSVPPSTRDALYQNLPPAIKSTLRWRLQEFQLNEKPPASLIKAEMEKTLQWLAPMANNTTKAHHGFGWVGEWACIGTEAGQKPAGPTSLIRIETLYHADKEKTEAYIFELIVFLHHFISQLRPGRCFTFSRSPVKSLIRFPSQKISSSAPLPSSSSSSLLTLEDKEMLRGLKFHEASPGISKSQEFEIRRPRLSKNHRLSKSSNHSPTAESKHESRKTPLFPVIDFDIDLNTTLDVIDRVDGL